MQNDAHAQHAERTCNVEVSPAEVDAGADLTVTIRVTSPDDFDLTGQPASIRGADDTELGSAALQEAEEAVYAAEIPLKAPLAVGEHNWRAVLAAVEHDETLFDEVGRSFSFVVRPHLARMQVWGMPSAIPAGGRFNVKVGVKCTSACKLAGRAVAIFDQDGAEAAAGHLREEPAPGTTALYFAELAGTAPASVGMHRWRAVAPASESGLPHAAGEVAFSVTVVSPPDREVTIEAIDRDKGTPVKGLQVVLHPYRALTGEDGIARIKVAQGSYRLHVSGLKYVPYDDVVDATGDVTLRADMVLEPKRDSYLD
jgi:hypothetical protein